MRFSASANHAAADITPQDIAGNGVVKIANEAEVQPRTAGDRLALRQKWIHHTHAAVVLSRVQTGGRLDGAYGVLAALEVARTLRESGLAAAERVAVASFHDEEGVSGNGFEGSLFFCAGPETGFR